MQVFISEVNTGELFLKNCSDLFPLKTSLKPQDGTQDKFQVPFATLNISY